MIICTTSVGIRSKREHGVSIIVLEDTVSASVAIAESCETSYDCCSRHVKGSCDAIFGSVVSAALVRGALAGVNINSLRLSNADAWLPVRAAQSFECFNCCLF